MNISWGSDPWLKLSKMMLDPMASARLMRASLTSSGLPAHHRLRIAEPAVGR